MAEANILILDDEEKWLYRHRGHLEDAGFSCYATKLATEAIKIAKTDSTIKFAIIDEILYVPPIPINPRERELQRWQGHGVVREITAQRLDIQIIVVTSAPQLSSEESEDSNKAFRHKTKELRRQKCVIDIVHKQDIEEDPEETYSWIVELLKKPRVLPGARTVKPKILIGLGFTQEEYMAMAEQINMGRKKRLPMAPFFKLGGDPVLNSFVERAKEKTVWVEIPGMKTPERVSGIKDGSSAYQILEKLALQSERNKKVIIRERDYQYSPRKTRKTNITEAPEYDPRSVRDFAFEYAEDGRRRTSTGVQFEGSVEQTNRLKVAVHRLSQKLAELNLGAARQLFDYKLEHKGYQPSFTLSIMVYAIKAKKRKSR